MAGYLSDILERVLPDQTQASVKFEFHIINKEILMKVCPPPYIHPASVLPFPWTSPLSPRTLRSFLNQTRHQD